ncbi:MAG: hypothetical protein JXP34_08745 [Planctomycetes bacterium]|nr:hypothetical protein [Planctomycetota bacterium]
MRRVLEVWGPAFIAALLTGPVCDRCDAQPATFDFDDGTTQGWTLQGAFDEDGDGPFSSSFALGWHDRVEYPSPPGNDASGDQEGALMLGTLGGHGITNPGATWWIMQFHSPDLSGSAAWQNAQGYTAKIAECMGAMTEMRANLFVKVYDNAQSRVRYFYNGEAQILVHDIYGDANADWNEFQIDWSEMSGFPEDRVIQEIHLNIFGLMNGAYQGGVYLDEVASIPGPTLTPAAPSNLQLHLLPGQVHVTWQDNADNEDGFLVEYVQLPAIFPIRWQKLATLGPNATSYQMDDPEINKTYEFRVSAFNEHGSSSPCDPESIQVLLVLDWLEVDSPVGGEIWQVGTVHAITWRAGMFAPARVTIDYSLDGGSHWVSPAIAASISNTGSYAWTIPDTVSDTCILRVRDAIDGLPYDLSDSVFAIERPGTATKFLRGDPNESGRADIADAVYTLDYLFDSKPLGCADSADVNDDGQLDLADPIFLLTYLFAHGPSPAAPFESCGTDPTLDALPRCPSFGPCP